MVLTVYRDFNVCCCGRPIINLIKIIIKFHHIKIRLLQFLHMFTDFDNELKLICILTQATITIKCAFLRDKNVILLLILSGNTNLLLDLKRYHMQK